MYLTEPEGWLCAGSLNCLIVVLLFRGGLGEVGESFAALELCVLDHAFGS
jgi:hypothetical protein